MNMDAKLLDKTLANPITGLKKYIKATEEPMPACKAA